MDVCVLGCTPGHIPRYMSQTSNNNIRLLSYLLWCLLWFLLCLLWFLLWHLFWTPVMMPVMIPVTTPVMYSCYDYLVTLILHAWITVTWDKGIYMRVSLFGLFLRCTSLMEPWLKRIRSALLIIGFTRISVLWVLSWLVAHTQFYPLLHQSLVLLLSFTCLYAPVHVSVFNAWLWFDFMDTPVLTLARHLALLHYSPGEFWLLWILMSRF